MAAQPKESQKRVLKVGNSKHILLDKITEARTKFNVGPYGNLFAKVSLVFKKVPTYQFTFAILIRSFVIHN